LKDKAMLQRTLSKFLRPHPPTIQAEQLCEYTVVSDRFR
jgi:hypothetical protein